MNFHVRVLGYFARYVLITDESELIDEVELTKTTIELLCQIMLCDVARVFCESTNEAIGELLWENDSTKEVA